MKYYHKILISALLACANMPAVNAKVTFGTIFTDNMVLQQDANVKFHGTAIPGKVIKIKASWSSKPITVKTDSEGKWSVFLHTPAAGGPYTISGTDGDGTTTLTNVLTGDVWVCGGQSNMEMPMRGYAGQPTEGTIDYIVKADANRQLRLFQQTKEWSTTPREDVAGGEWTVATPASVGDFSAVGYIFGDYIQEVLDTPVGLIHCCWGNSKIESWMPAEAFKTYFPDIKLPDTDATEFGWLEGTPTLLFNGMINPWDGFPVKGVVWYQGEANNPYPELYPKLFPVMKQEWEKIFANDSLPFYYVQLAPFNAEDGRAFNYADFRQAQVDIQRNVPEVSMVSIGDLGDSIFIHAPKKVKVGQRLAYQALDHTYGRKGADVDTPIARACTYNPEKHEIWVTFDNAGHGLVPTQCTLAGFEVVDADGNIYDAPEAKASGGEGVLILSPIDDPVEVRYCHRNYYESSLFNNSGIPASPFKLKINK
ncbi:MAG: sialate O-acetylesterase [Muribaculaceae bacterium]|nr:sialate O-acetylesterase [Muribaculaceae bacterium]